MVVSDSGPILSFIRAGLIDLLHHIVGELMIPSAVYDDIVIHGKGKPGAQIVASAAWIIRQEVRDRNLVENLPQRLHLGEREAIALAKKLGATLLVDEHEARKEAGHLGIAHFGTLRLLKEAKDRGILLAVKPSVDALISSGTYISDAVYNEFLRQMHEE